jgi:tRNA-uridine 2-sulfurtransferase
MSGKTVAVAMSGGVDSSVAAYLLKEAGYNVFGVTLSMDTDDSDSSRGLCGGSEEISAAGSIAKQLGIPLHTVSCRSDFNERILRESWNEYASGRTPNPCVVCNRVIKFGVLRDIARSLGATDLATGHYARIESAATEDPQSSRFLLKGMDRNKDQSYFLYRLSQTQLKAVSFPLGSMKKTEIRDIAREKGFVNADRRESQDVCLALSGEQFGELLRLRFREPEKPGHFVDRDGNILGEHNGIHRFTVGQRRGLGIALGKPAYVTAIHSKTRAVVISTDPRDLLCRIFTVSDVHWINPAVDRLPLTSEVKIRYLHKAAPARLSAGSGGCVTVEFESHQRAVTPGQSAVFYIDDRVLGGGIIESVNPNQ